MKERPYMEQVILSLIHKDGPPWNIVARYENFDDAAKKRKELSEDKDYQVKIHWLRKSDRFAVKTRMDPEVIRKKEKAKRKKKRRKKK